ncbi:MAG: tetratricopeptide repeat protein [Acidobacteriota bacterium]
MRKVAARGNRGEGEPAVDPRARLVPVVLRALHGWTQAGLARRAGIHPSALSKHEMGEVSLSREQMEQLAAAARVPLAFAELVLASAAVLADSEDRPQGGDFAADLACRIAALLAPVFSALEARPAIAPVEPDPGDPLGVALAAEQWRSLAKRTPAQRALIVEHGREYQTEALLVLVCDESEQAESGGAAEVLGLAELARKIAEKAPGSAGRRARREGYAQAFVANARRAANLFPAADAAFARAHLLFAKGGEEDPGQLDQSRIFDREAVLRRSQGRPAKALALHDQALAVCRPENRARLLTHLADTCEEAGDLPRAIEALREAIAAPPGGEGEERRGWLARFHLARILLQAGRTDEASGLLPDLRREGETLGTGPDLLRLRRLTANVAAALGRTAEALAELAAVRRELAAIPLPADAVIAGLLEAEILLREDRTGKARSLVRTLQPDVESLGLKRETLVAYRHFVAAVEREAATATQARELARAIERAGTRPEGPVAA